MARGGKKAISCVDCHLINGSSNVGPNGDKLRRQRKERVAYDNSGAKTVLWIVGVALVILLLWLDYRGY